MFLRSGAFAVVDSHWFAPTFWDVSSLDRSISEDLRCSLPLTDWFLDFELGYSLKFACLLRKLLKQQLELSRFILGPSTVDDLAGAPFQELEMLLSPLTWSEQTAG